MLRIRVPESSVSEAPPPPPHRCSLVDGRKTSVNVSLALIPWLLGILGVSPVKKEEKGGHGGCCELEPGVKASTP